MSVTMKDGTILDINEQELAKGLQYGPTVRNRNKHFYNFFSFFFACYFL